MGLDTMGNMFATRAGTDPDAPPVYVGSHLTPSRRYDGVLAFYWAGKLIRTDEPDIKTKQPDCRQTGPTKKASRYAPAMSSRICRPAHAGLGLRVDADGSKTFGNELKRIGWQGDEVVGARKMHAFFELYIEQGPILRLRAKTSALSPMAKVFHGLKLRSLARMSIPDHNAHAQNADWRWARIQADQIALSYAPHAVWRGRADIKFPNSRNVIPGKVVLQSTSAPRPAASSPIWKRLRNRSRGNADDRAEIEFVMVSTRNALLLVLCAAPLKRLGYSHMNFLISVRP
jgi:N-carbamoyl-L-amino-acid hydrolase